MQAQSSNQQVTVAESIIAQRQADLDYARLQLSYASIVAPVDGIASRKNIQPGQFINAGSPLFVIVSNKDVYVLANFKETQLEKMKQSLIEGAQ